VLATFVTLPLPQLAEIAAVAGFDAVVLDTEHGSIGVESLPSLVMAAHVRGIHAVVRVRVNEPSLIGAALDAGADGVLVPQISSPAEATATVSAARFAPEGTRGANAWVRGASYGNDDDFFGSANARAAVLVMVEGSAGVAALPKIVDVAGLDGVFVGPVDLSHALGVPGQTQHPTVLEHADKLADLCRERGVASGVFASTPAMARRWVAAGISFVTLGVDADLARQGMTSALREVRS
jgi:4-hydroxy-2-oxoheptanedioate aldolase